MRTNTSDCDTAAVLAKSVYECVLIKQAGSVMVLLFYNIVVTPYWSKCVLTVYKRKPTSAQVIQYFIKKSAGSD
jgi:hypothetical protein